MQFSDYFHWPEQLDTCSKLLLSLREVLLRFCDVVMVMVAEVNWLVNFCFMDVDFDTAKQKVAGTLRKIPCENTPILSIPAQKFLIGRWS